MRARPEGLCGMKLSYRGEPLLHPRIADMVAYAKDHGVLDIYFNTNAMLLTEKKAKALIAARLNRISISVEGTDPVAFERERVGARFEKIKENVGRLKRLREEAGTEFPKIRIQNRHPARHRHGCLRQVLGPVLR